MIERPIKINAQIALWRQLFQVAETLKIASGFDEIMKLFENNDTSCRQKSDESLSMFSDWRNILSDVSKVTLSTQQVVVQLSESLLR
jgi:hypothetical protein